jgi:CubicO group peptidase (beta-lactamase class C family)
LSVPFRKALCGLALTQLLGATPASADIPAPQWPAAEWPTRSLTQAGVDEARFAALTDYLFPAVSPEDEKARRGVRTDAFLLIGPGGHLLFERYARGYGATSRHYGWSMTKTVIAALTGIAEKEGRLRRDAAVIDVVKAWAGRPQLQALRVEHLLRMSSGLDWAETYEYSPLKSTVIAMLYTVGFRDMAGYVAGRSRAFAPGTRYRYSSGDTNLLSAVLKAALGPADYDAYPFDKLFTPLGMRSAVFEQDLSGTYVGSSYLYATARDFARFGYLYLRGGVWNGAPILPADWVAYSMQMAPAYYTTQLADDEKDENPGASMWLNLGDEKRGLPPPWKDAPRDTFAALGHWGQSIFVIPSRDLVAVRLADDRGKVFDPNRYLKMIIDSFGEAAAGGK